MKHAARLTLIVCTGLALAACEEQTSGGEFSLPDPGTAKEGFGSRIGNVMPSVRNVEVQSRLTEVARAVQTWQLTKSSMPESVEQMMGENMLPRNVAFDPWGHAIRIESTGTDSFRVWTIGPDGENGTDDDIEITR
ncbi:MAG: type II secretion system protein GspG [Planctomycetota bacterium]